MRKTITIKFGFGEEVKLRTDPEKTRIITGITLRTTGKLYELAWGESTSWHQDIEIERVTKVKVKGFGRD